MRVIVDAREYDSLDPQAPAKYGASEPLALRYVNAFKHHGHEVDAIYAGNEEVIADGVRWWPWNKHPTKCDVLISCEWLIHLEDFTFDRLFVPLNKINPILDQHEEKVDGFLVFNEEHKRQLLVYNSTIKPEQCKILRAGVEPPVEAEKRPQSLIWCHTPERGLFHVLRQFPHVLKEVPEATLTITYGLERSWETNKWLQDAIAEYLSECIDIKNRYADNIIDLGRSTKEQVQQAMAETLVMPYPCDAPAPGIVTTFSAMECAAAGCALLVPEMEGFPEEFGGVARILPIPINEQEWIENTIELLLNPTSTWALGEAGREWAKTRTWEKWESDLMEIVG